MPKLSTRTWMKVVALVALNLAVIPGPGPDDWPFLRFVRAQMPMLSLLALAAWKIVEDLRNGRESAGFAIGFLACGFFVFAFYMFALHSSAWLNASLNYVAQWTLLKLVAVGIPRDSSAMDFLGLVLVEAMTLVPPLAIGVLGGYVADRLGLCLSLRRSDLGTPLPVFAPGSV